MPSHQHQIYQSGQLGGGRKVVPSQRRLAYHINWIQWQPSHKRIRPIRHSPVALGLAFKKGSGFRALAPSFSLPHLSSFRRLSLPKSRFLPSVLRAGYVYLLIADHTAHPNRRPRQPRNSFTPQSIVFSPRDIPTK